MGNWEGVKVDFGKINGWKFVTIILAVLIGVFMWTGYGMQNQLSQQVLAINKYQKDSVTFTRTINSLGQEVSTQTSIIIVKTKEVQKLLLANSDLSELNHQIKIKSQTDMNNLKADWFAANSENDGDSLYIDQPGPFDDFLLDDSTGVEYIALGTKFKKRDEWYNLSGTILKSGLNIEHMSIVNDDEYNLGYKKKRLIDIFKKDEITLEVIHNNPYTKTTALKDTELEQPKKKWFQTNAAKIGFGIVGGTVLGVYIAK